MNRRTLLRRASTLGALGTVALTGCMGPTSSPDGGDGNAGGTGGAGDSPTETPPWDDRVTDVSVETTNGECAGNETPTATVSFDEEDSTVSVDGLVTAPTPCHRVVVESVDYDDESDELDVLLGTTEDDQDVCVDCVGELAFEATISLDGTLPATVSVRQSDARLARVERGDQPAEPVDITVVDTAFEVVGTGATADGQTADVAFHDDENRIDVTGTVQGSDGCKTADLEDVTYDSDDDRVTISVITRNREGTDDQFCSQALVAISYEGSVTFEGGIPGSATIRHDGRGITSRGHGSATATPPETTDDG